MAKYSNKVHGAFLALTGAAALFTAGTAHAAIQYGELRVSSNVTLSADRFGNVVFDAPNVILDCAGHQVHISSYSKARGPNGQKIGIYALAKDGITIKNCNVVGGFDVGVWVDSTDHASVSLVSAGVGAGHTGFEFDTNTSLIASQLSSSGNSIGLSVFDDQGGFYEAGVDSSVTGIELEYSSQTQIAYSTVTNNQTGFLTLHNTGVSLIGDDVEQNLTGINSTNDTLVLSGDQFRNNTNNGVSITANVQSAFYNNDITGNGSCDAWEGQSTGDVWSGNFIGHTCGTVPTPH